MDYAYPASSYFFPYQVREVEKNGLFFRGFLQEHRIDMVIDQDPQTYYKLYPFSKALRGVYIISVIHLRGEKRCVSKFGRSENI